ncbi:uncharacterized protein M421DRAFT_6544 [Didymella exigua CBS 183.55]|uniref:Zn(2)-C6 fungal-type domain-containing protein n=1 Tax=Didymella exigua CBS 183.55 TaxID=1150837 RepID=A0A6A5RFD4_9PLEO|nr:uncharacterized protein M421DRAFT_6544 [Didymella exigua CBS 183.55]KAF1926985.1 hypothetical protein M421DRAFT_6544 [Didymella exigua CBS 183.55]
MSSGDESACELSSDDDTPQRSRASSRRQSHTPDTPRKRRRIESADPFRVRKYYLEGKYSDAYRVLFNEDVTQAAARFGPEDGVQHYTAQYGASTWTGQEQATLFAALARLGKDEVAGIAQAVGTKSIPETRELLLLLNDAAANEGDLALTLRHVPAAMEVGHECNEELEVMAGALAWYQEQWDVAEEQKRYGDYWLVTPAIADDIETAINGPSRAASTRPTTPAEPGPPRTGPGIAGSCERCKHHKIRCDRKTPCTSCARMKKKVVCEYKPSKLNHRSVDLMPQSPKVEEQAPPVIALQPQILQEIPQASLLHAENMLSLSRDLFMNRSPDIPSPWPHWTAYASEQVPQPSMMRTAFNDFYTLAVSVTKRLMQTAMAQATSRLRSQRRRTKKGVMPFVKTRDVLSAIDILGLKRNGRSRWTRVARRCNVRVFDEQRTTRFKIEHREVSWDQAEQILGLYDAVSGPPTADQVLDQHAADPGSHGEAAFERRAARAGTPLPMEYLSLSKTDSNTALENTAESASVVSDDEEEEDSHHEEQGTERPSSAEPEDIVQDGVPEEQTLEQFDQEASRREEEALCNRLELIIEMQRSPIVDRCEDDQQKLFNKVDDWRNWTDYHATWEEHETPVPASRFDAYQKLPTTPAAYLLDVDADVLSDASANSQQFRRKRRAAVELQAQNPHSYAAMQSDVYSLHENASRSDESESDEEADANVPTQSTEDSGLAQSTSSRDAMEWER